MSNTETAIPTVPLSFREIARRIALPFFLFALVLAVLLFLSWSIVVPAFTSIDINGVARNMDDLEAHAADLRAQILSLEAKRDAFLFPATHTAYELLKDRKQRAFRFLAKREAIDSLAASVDGESPGAVVVERYRFRTADRVLEISGDVRGVGLRSMTVLAQFVEELRDLPFVASLTGPRFLREQDAAGGYHSPFSIALSLQ